MSKKFMVNGYHFESSDTWSGISHDHRLSNFGRRTSPGMILVAGPGQTFAGILAEGEENVREIAQKLIYLYAKP